MLDSNAIVVWQGTIGSFLVDAPPRYGLVASWVFIDEAHYQPQEEKNMEYVAQQPLHIPRKSLIERLQERKAEEEQARKDAQDKATESRKALLEAVGQFNADQVANILAHFVVSNQADLLKWVEEKVEAKKFVTKELEVTHVEGQLDKLIRVLELAADEEIEVAPSDPVYPLL